MNNISKQRDNLTEIKGIGRVRQKWLQDSFGIQTFRDLALLSVEEIETRLKSEGKIPSRNDINTWLAQAKAFVAEASELEQIDMDIAESDGDVEEIRKPKPILEANIGKETAVSSPEPAWKPFASFVVEYQARAGLNQAIEHRTTVHYMEADTGEVWADIERDKLCQWMEKEARVAQPVVKKVPVPAQTLGISAASLRATKVRLIQQPDFLATVDIEAPERPFLGHIQHEKPFTLEVAFDLPEPTASDMPLPLTEYQAQCHLHSLSSGEPTQLLDMKTNLPVSEHPSYRAKISNLSLEQGMYELGILLRGTNPLSTNYVKLPKLNVL